MHGASLVGLASAALLLLSAPAWAAEIPGIVSVAGVPQGAGIESSGGAAISCLAVIQPFSIWAPSVSASAKAPTSSPVPPYVEASIDFRIQNVGTEPIPAPYTVGIYNPHYTTVIQVWNFEFVNATQGQVYGSATAEYEKLDPDAENSVYLGILLSSTQSDVSPRNITINGQQCTVQLENNITNIKSLPMQAPAEPGTAATENARSEAAISTAAVEAATQPVSISNGQIIGVDGTPIGFKAVNYFGFNNGATMFDGLYAGDTALSLDFGQVLYRIQALGFNTIRVPFSFVNLFSAQPTSFTRTCTPTSETALRNNLTPPGVDSSNVAFPVQVYPENTPADQCNGAVPNSSVYQRFLYIIQFLARNNFYILIDNHSEDPTVQNNPGQWVTYWTQLMTDIAADGPSSLRVMVDPINEPDHIPGYSWTQVGPLYLRVMDAIHAVSPSTLFFLEGCGQLGFPGLNWGDGFVTDPSYIQQYGLSDPNPFFQTLLNKPYLNNVGISPHIYPPSVTFAGQGFSGSSLWFRMYNSFGYLNTIGYGGHLFPIFIGEVGSKFATQTDVQSMNDMAAFFRADAGTGTQHNPINSVAYWDWNANSGDTGGIVADNWVDILWVKINWLIDAIQLKPWYLGGASSTPSSPPPLASSPPPVQSSPPPSPPPNSPPPTVRSPPPSPPPRAASPPPPVVRSPSPPPPVARSPSPPPPIVRSPSPPPPVVRSPSPPPPVVRSPSPPPPRAASSPPPKPVASSPPPPVVGGGSGGGGSPCVAFSTQSNPWASGTGSTSNSINVFLNNTGSAAINTPYSLAVSGNGYIKTQYSWNWDVASVQGGTVSGSVNAGSWEALQPNGANVINVGFVVDSTSSDPNSFAPTRIAINGVSCRVVPAPSMNGR